MRCEHCEGSVGVKQVKVRTSGRFKIVKKAMRLCSDCQQVAQVSSVFPPCTAGGERLDEYEALGLWLSGGYQKTNRRDDLDSWLD